MATDIYGQNAFTTLTGNISTTTGGASETWAVASTALPFVQIVSGQQMRCTVASPGENNPEVVFITGIVDTTHFTVLRGQEGTTAKIHSVNDVLANNITAGMMNGLINAGAAAQLYNPVLVTSNYTAAPGAFVEADATSGNIVVTTTAATSGFALTVVKIDSSANTVTFSPVSGTVNGAANFVLTTQWDALDAVCNGTSWRLH